jgi:hypothetical protein
VNIAFAALKEPTRKGNYEKIHLHWVVGRSFPDSHIFVDICATETLSTNSGSGTAQPAKSNASRKA